VSEFKIGDKVWVLCLVLEVKNNSVLVCGNGNKSWWVRDKDCKPVEPEAVEQPTNRELTEAQKIAERTLKAIWATQPKPEPEPVVKQSLTTESDPINPSHYKQGGIEDLKKARWYLDRLIQEEESK